MQGQVLNVLTSSLVSRLLVEAFIFLSKTRIAERVKDAIQAEYASILETHKGQLNAEIETHMARRKAANNTDIETHMGQAL